jgi:indole-3-glycerol phosphate synthase
MSNILERIVASKKTEIAASMARVPEAVLERKLSGAPAALDFMGALMVLGEVRVIAEVKKASPSAGVIRNDFDPVAIAQIYESHGAACISVLTDTPFFQGNLQYLIAIRAAVSLPLLRKDFILTRYQILEARLAGADAILLIAEILTPTELAKLLREAQSLGLQALVELHDAESLQAVLDSGARMIGVNNRDLRTFETRLEHTLEVANRVPKDCFLVSESGIRTHADVKLLQQAGVRAILVGESLMRSPDIGKQLDLLRGPAESVL